MGREFAAELSEIVKAEGPGVMKKVGEQAKSKAAEVLGISTSALKMRVSRARAQVLDQLQEADDV